MHQAIVIGVRTRYERQKTGGRRSPVTCQFVEADALRAETLPPALNGIDVAYYLIHSMSGRVEGFEERDRHRSRLAMYSNTSKLRFTCARCWKSPSSSQT